MNDPLVEGAQERQGQPGTDSQQSATRASRKAALPAGANPVPSKAQNALDLRSEVPLHLKPVLNGYAEVEAVGIAAERTMRRYIATGRVKKSIIRTGRRLRFVKDVLIDELRQAEE